MVEATLAMERYRTTLILGGILIVLAVVAIVLSNNNKGTTTGTPTPTPTVYVWQEPNAVSSIDVVSGTNKVSLVKDASKGTWALTAPVSHPADEFAVGGVADTLQNLQATFSVTDTSDLTQFGLGPSAMAVSLAFSDTQGTKHSFTVGKTTIDGSGYYIQADGKKVYVVPNTTIEPIRSWLTTPPIETPSPTPLAVTVVPPTSTPTETATPAPGTTAAPGITATATSPPGVGPPAPTAGLSPTP
jgi:hypothetical protein